MKVLLHLDVSMVYALVRGRSHHEDDADDADADHTLIFEFELRRLLDYCRGEERTLPMSRTLRLVNIKPSSVVSIQVLGEKRTLFVGVGGATALLRGR